MGARVKLHQAALATLEKAQKQALEMTAQAMLSDMVASAIVPKDTGEMERSGFVDTSNLDTMQVAIVFDTPYARRLYWHPEYSFRTDKNENAQGLWMQVYIDGEKRGLPQETLIKFLKERSGGLIK